MSSSYFTVIWEPYIYSKKYPNKTQFFIVFIFYYFQFESFIPCSERIVRAVTDMVLLFPEVILYNKVIQEYIIKKNNCHLYYYTKKSQIAVFNFFLFLVILT